MDRNRYRINRQDECIINDLKGRIEELEADHLETANDMYNAMREIEELEAQLATAKEVIGLDSVRIKAFERREGELKGQLAEIAELPSYSPNDIHCVGGNRRVVRLDKLQAIINREKSE